MRLDNEHVTVSLLKTMIPRAHVAGGCFSTFLPHPSDVPPSLRAEKFYAAKAAATIECISSLLLESGRSPDMPIATGDGGERLWPMGLAGSLTYKGTVVLGALAKETSSYSALGIDLEMIDGHEAELSQNEIAPEGIPNGTISSIGTLISFSAKEAIFKAQFPASRQKLDFSQVRVLWESEVAGSLHATARVPDGRIFELLVFISSSWVVCGAFTFP